MRQGDLRQEPSASSRTSLSEWAVVRHEGAHIADRPAASQKMPREQLASLGTRVPLVAVGTRRRRRCSLCVGRSRAVRRVPYMEDTLFNLRGWPWLTHGTSPATSCYIDRCFGMVSLGRGQTPAWQHHLPAPAPPTPSCPASLRPGQARGGSYACLLCFQDQPQATPHTLLATPSGCHHHGSGRGVPNDARNRHRDAHHA